MSCDIPGQPAEQAYLDDEIAALALQLEEINCRDENSKGKNREDDPPDVDLAVSAYQSEVETHMQYLHDLKLAHSIAHAVDTDGQAIAEATQGEYQAQQDRKLALQLNEGGNEQAETLPPDSQADLDSATQEGTLRSLIESFAVDNGSDVDENVAGPSTAYARHQGVVLDSMSKFTATCCVCDERFQQCNAYRLRCGDTYCVDCLKDHFMRSTKDEDLFPPRCCREPIPLGLIAGRMSPEELDTYQSAEVELSTPNRTYCSNITCSRFIPPARITGDRAECEQCNTETCAKCKQTYHYETDCPEDPALQATLSLAGNEGWQRCFRCRAMVELHCGCYHMTCKCKAEFCYLCGVEWRNCRCEQWDERNLLNRAEEVVDREAGRALPQPERQRRVIEMRDELLENHECEHSRRFERILGGGRRGFRCEMCAARHWKYILQCRRCHVRVCEECRRNRI